MGGKGGATSRLRTRSTGCEQRESRRLLAPGHVTLPALCVGCDLQFRGIEDAETARFITSRFGRNPLTLRLASDIVKQDEGSVEALRGVKGRNKVLRILSAGQETIQRALYTRILGHIHGDQVRALAHPGYLASRVGVELEPDVFAQASADDRVRVIERRAQELLGTGDTTTALRELEAGVAAHGLRMPLAVLLATAQYRAARHREALATIDAALGELRPDADSRLSLQLEELAAQIEEENGRLEAAAEHVQAGYELAAWLGEPTPAMARGARRRTPRYGRVLRGGLPSSR